ncbi:MAG: DUF2085 domain-containing protein [Prevotellaceae bacterium]|jgi:uncharacterized membrane protein|nr:DUF2085 domain-containing protein [Prevotellaceae bacterium]
MKQQYKIEFVTCHRIPERSFFYKGKQFPVCARCTGIYIGYIAIFIFAITLTYIPLLWSFALLLPALIDGLTQAYCHRESNNILRLITGIMLGIGISSLGAIFAEIISNLIIHFLKN